MEQIEETFILKRMSYKTLHLKCVLDVSVEGIGVIGDIIGRVSFRLNSTKELEACFFPNSLSRINHNGEYKEVYSLKSSSYITKSVSNRFATKGKFVRVSYSTFPYTKNGEKLVLMNVPTAITLAWSNDRIRKYKINGILCSDL